MSSARRRATVPAGSRLASVPREDDLAGRDPLGRMALYSDPEPEPEPARREHLFVECSSCLKETPVSATQLLTLSLPASLHLPFVRRYPSFVRCPACGRRTWVRVRYRR